MDKLYATGLLLQDADAFFAQLTSSCSVISRSLVRETVRVGPAPSSEATSSDVCFHLSDVELNLSVTKTKAPGKVYLPR
jgi:hypothetical protein